MLPNLMRLLARFLAGAFFAASVTLTPVWASDDVASFGTLKSAYHHTAWTSKDGAPGSIWSMAQTPDGWLWLGTTSGLYRFDGVTFDYVDLRPAKSAASRAVNSVIATGNGELWVSYSDGAVVSVLNSDPKTIAFHPGLTAENQAYGLNQDGLGDIWAFTNHGFFALKGGKWIKPDHFPKAPTDNLTDFMLDGAGDFWLVANNGVTVMRKSSRRLERVSTPILDGEDIDLFTGSDGRAWAFSKRAIFPLSKTYSPLPDAEAINKHTGHALRANDGALWTISCGTGVCRRKDPELMQHGQSYDDASDSFTRADGLTSDLPRTILEDREGTIWVGTTAGLDSFRRNNFRKVEFPVKAINFHIAAADDGGLWVGTNGHAQSGDEFLWHVDTSPEKMKGFNSAVSALLVEKNGDLLMSVADKGMVRYADGGFQSANLPPAPPPDNRRAYLLIRDSDGALWASFASLSVYRLDGNKWTENGGLLGIPTANPESMFVAPDGKLWLGYESDNVRVVNHGLVESITEKDGLRIGDVTSILIGKTSLLGGARGVSFLSAGTWHTLRVSDPAALLQVTGMIQSSDGATWFDGNAGAARIDASDLDHAVSDPTFVSPVRVFGEDDGLPGSAQDDYTSLVKASDGRLWFAQADGLAWIDPNKLQRNTQIPTIAIRGVSTPTSTFAPYGSITLPARTTNVRIAYTALSLADSVKNHFKVRLDGIDADWQDMGNRREASYSNLGPGDYRFRVRGSNNDGVWNDIGTEIPFRIKPTFFQTWWFVALEVFTGLIVLYMFFRFQHRQAIARERDRISVRHAERERIARDLHDSFLQVLSFLLLRFDRIGQGMAPGERARLKLDEALDQAEAALTEGRDRVSLLRDNAMHLIDVEGYLAEFARELAKDYSATWTINAHGASPAIRAHVADEICAIGKEAVNNAFQHANATNINVDILYGIRHFVLTVRDNGVGLPKDVELSQRRQGHWGLVGMRERAEAIGGTVQVRRHPQGGTEVTLKVSSARVL